MGGNGLYISGDGESALDCACSDCQRELAHAEASLGVRTGTVEEETYR